MSQENVEAHNRTIEAFNRGDVEAMLENLDPEVEWHPAMQAFFAGEPVYRGYAGVRTMFRDFYAAFDEIHVEPSEVRDLGDRTVAIGHMRARGGESGAETESSWGAVVERVQGCQGVSDLDLPRCDRSPPSRRAVGVGLRAPLRGPAHADALAVSFDDGAGCRAATRPLGGGKGSRLSRRATPRGATAPGATLTPERPPPRVLEVDGAGAFRRPASRLCRETRSKNGQRTRQVACAGRHYLSRKATLAVLMMRLG